MAALWVEKSRAEYAPSFQSEKRGGTKQRDYLGRWREYLGMWRRIFSRLGDIAVELLSGCLQRTSHGPLHVVCVADVVARPRKSVSAILSDVFPTFRLNLLPQFTAPRR